MKYSLLIVILLAFFVAGCKTVTPVTTGFQSAKIHPGLFELNAYGYATQFANGNGAGIESFSAGFQIAEGFEVKPFFLPGHVRFAPRFRGQLTASRFEPTRHMVAYFSDEFKFSIIKDKVAIAPLSGGFHISDEFIHYQIEPLDIFATIPITHMFEVNFAFRFIGLTYNSTPDSDEPATFLAFNAGLGIGPDIYEVAIRPEFSYVHNLTGDDHRIAFGIGTSLYSEREKKMGSRKKGSGR